MERKDERANGKGEGTKYRDARTKRRKTRVNNRDQKQRSMATIKVAKAKHKETRVKNTIRNKDQKKNINDEEVKSMFDRLPGV